MNGVKDKIITSFEVKTVKTDTTMYKYKNNLICPVRAFFKATFAKKRKNPNSSKKMASACKSYKAFPSLHIPVVFLDGSMISV